MDWIGYGWIGLDWIGLGIIQRMRKENFNVSKKYSSKGIVVVIRAKMVSISFVK